MEETSNRNGTVEMATTQVSSTSIISSSEKSRNVWTNQIEFTLSCLGYAVGLGNVWRFPYLCYRNGGGAFLIPYTIMLAVCGLPLFFLELALGQYHGRGPNIIYQNLIPAFHGVGFAMLVVTFIVVLYYNLLIAWSVFYMFASFTSELGWEHCGNAWNTPGCFEREKSNACKEFQTIYWNNTCHNATELCDLLPNIMAWNESFCLDQNTNKTVAIDSVFKRTSPSEDYFLYYMLGVSPNIETPGNLQWQLVLCLLASWLIVLLCLIKGVKSVGKVVYFTALFPYALLLILLIRGVTLEGAVDGIYFYIVPKWDKIFVAQAWGDAAVQIFYSLGPAFGGLLTLASYNKFRHDCCKDAVIISIANCGTSVFAGFVVFSILGFMAQSQGVIVDDVIESGPGLAFIAYPEAVTKMPVAPLWSFLFFFMLIILGMDSQFAMVETLITAIQDQWPKSRRFASTTVIIVCFVGFLFGLPLCCQNGVYLFTLIDNYAAGFSLLVIALTELCVVTWIYGLNKFKKNIEKMIGRSPGIYWTLTWKYLAQLTVIGIIIFSIVHYSPVKFGSYILPVWANALGWSMAAASIVLIPIFMVYELCKTSHEGMPLSTAFKPSERWGPAEKASEFSLETTTVQEMSTYQNCSESNNHIQISEAKS